MVQNKASVAYYLMFDNQMRMKSGAYLREELSEASDAMMQHPSGAAAQALVEGLPVLLPAMTAALAACCSWALEPHGHHILPRCPTSDGAIVYCRQSYTVHNATRLDASWRRHYHPCRVLSCAWQG